MDFSELNRSVDQVVDQQYQRMLDRMQSCEKPLSTLGRSWANIRKTEQNTLYIVMEEEDYFSGSEQIVVSIDQFASLPSETKAKLYEKYLIEQVSNFSDQNQPIKFHQHDFFEIVYVYKGGCHNVVSGKHSHLLQGDLCLFNLQALHSITLDNEESVVINFLIRKSLFESIFVSMLSNANLIQHFFINSLFLNDTEERSLLFHCKAGSTVEFYLLQLILGYCSDEQPNQNTLKALLVCFLNDLAKEHQKNLENSVLLETGRSFSSILSYIGEHYQNSTTESVADHFHYNKQYLSNLIYKQTGQTLSQIIRAIKLKQAADLIKNSTIPIAKVVELVGYSDRSHFDKAFKQKYCTTPAQYRKIDSLPLK